MSFQYANWPLPNGVYAGWSTRQSGVSMAPFDSNNIAKHVSDAGGVELNRAILKNRLKNHPDIHWLKQTHSTDVVELSDINIQLGQDGATTSQLGQACCVMTADCLPVFLWSASGDRIAAIHAGWRGLANGIVVNAVHVFFADDRFFAGFGPAISQSHFEVGQDVFDAFRFLTNHESCFKPGNQKGKYWCDLAGLAERQLIELGAQSVYQSNLCTYANESHFYSYRRDKITGRMANLIWKA